MVISTVKLGFSALALMMTLTGATAQSGDRLARDPGATGALPAPGDGPRLSIRSQSARDFALDYLAAWSSSNPVAIESVSHFYGPSVTFHGRRLSAGALVDIKQRFARQWPERDYRHRPDSVRVRCEPGSTLCRVSSVFDYAAANPRTGRRARGAETFELGVSFADGRPKIVYETSRKLRTAGR